jgi:hypothetical protein
MAIMAQRFECWFKQCDESILNGTSGGDFRQHFVRQDAAVKLCVCGARAGWNQAMKLCNLGRLDYVSGLSDIAGARRQ